MLARWKILIFACYTLLIFYSGYNIKATQEKLRVYKENEKSIIEAGVKASAYEDAKIQIDKIYENIDTKVTYENGYDCIIPADGLHILTEATR